MMADSCFAVHKTCDLTRRNDGDVHIGEALDGWRTIGTVRGLQSDVDIASFLVRYYEDTWRGQQSAALCVQCHTPLTLCCLKCSPILTTPPTSHCVSSTTSSLNRQTASPPSPLWVEQTQGAADGGSDASGRLTAFAGEGVVPKSGRGESSGQHKAVNHQCANLSNEAMSTVCRNTLNQAVLKQGYDMAKDPDKIISRNKCDIRDDDKRPGGLGTQNDSQDTSTSNAESTVMQIRNSGSQEELKCLACLRLFHEVDELIAHMQSHSREMTNKCELCRAAFLLPAVLQLHRKTHTQQSVQNGDVLKSFLHPTLKQSSCGQMSSCSDVEILNRDTAGMGIRKQNRLREFDSLQKGPRRRETLQTVSNSTFEEKESGIYEGDTDTEYDFCDSLPAERQQPGAQKGDEPTPALQYCKLNQISEFVADNERSVGNLRESQQIQNVTEKDEPSLSSVSSDWCGCQVCGASFKSLKDLIKHAQSHYRIEEQDSSSNCEILHPSSSQGAVQGKSLRCNASHLKQCEQLCSTSAPTSEVPQHVSKPSVKLRQKREKKTASSCKIVSNNTVIDPQLGVKDVLACDACPRNGSTTKKLQLAGKVNTRGKRRKFRCGHCGKELCNRQTLIAHERTHTGAKPFQCPHCSSTFRSSSNLRAHLRTHSGHTPYLCPQCGRGFKEITHLKRHLVSHSGERPHKCQQCGKAYVHATSLKEHMLSHSSSPKSWVCHQCGKAFANSKKLKVHLKTHASKGEGSRTQRASERRFACQVCGAVYQQASSLSRHKKLHELGAKSHTCSNCGKTFRDKYELRKHVRIHSGLTPYTCGQCSRKFREPSGYKRHLLWHSSLKPHACSKCPKRYTDSRSLKHHLQTHTGARPHCCKKCSKRFFTPWTLRLHLKHHVMSVRSSSCQEKSHICHQCGAAYLRASSLVRHQRLHNVAEGQNSRYQCSQCSRTFGDSSHLKRHLLSHSGEKPFVCASCGKAYADSHTLKDHMQVHTGVRSFVCEMCGKAFFNAKTLKEHARSHSDQRPFQCSQCSASYKHLSGLISHRRLHSGVRPFQCAECSKTFKDYTCYKRHLLTHTHHKPHVCHQCGKAYKDLKNLKHHAAQLHGHPS